MEKNGGDMPSATLRMEVRLPKNFYTPKPVHPECHSPRACMYYRYTLAYHRSCVMLKIPTVHSLKSVRISFTILHFLKN